ncbi:MAG: 30S ribosomal protein S6 [Abditibacteriota bacterium]|nr:30S ribosomal protein S6 [Abditibacteriota bacterium]
MIRTYEAIYILNPEFIEDEVNEFIDMIAGIVEQNGGTVLSKGIWDKRPLAYEINRQKDGIYCLMYFEAESTVPALVTRAFRINDDVIRGMITLIDKRYVDTSEIKAPGNAPEEEKEADSIVPDAEPVIPSDEEMQAVEESVEAESEEAPAEAEDAPEAAQEPAEEAPEAATEPAEEAAAEE